MRTELSWTITSKAWFDTIGMLLVNQCLKDVCQTAFLIGYCRQVTSLARRLAI